MSTTYAGRTRTRTQLLDRASLERFTVACGGDPARDAAPPPLAHWAWFLDALPDHALGPDGHAGADVFLPSFAHAPRRMFAASNMRFHAPLVLDTAAEEQTTIAASSEKSGRSGPLCFVELIRKITQDDTLRVEEHQTLVFRARGEPGADELPTPAFDAETPPPDGALWRPDTVALFRFSAATFNAHRIHYDLPYVRDVEHYPALVVHGPLTAARLAIMAARGGKLRDFSFRALAPLYAGQSVRLVRENATGVAALRCDGKHAMIANFHAG
jgi:3-methylfumaryl-CoA hydratase